MCWQYSSCESRMRVLKRVVCALALPLTSPCALLPLRPPTTWTLKVCWTWPARLWPTWSKAKPLKRSGRRSTLKMTSQRRRRRRLVFAPLSQTFRSWNRSRFSHCSRHDGKEPIVLLCLVRRYAKRTSGVKRSKPLEGWSYQHYHTE